MGNGQLSALVHFSWSVAILLFLLFQFVETRSAPTMPRPEVSPDNPAESHLEEVIYLWERVKSLEYLDEYHRDHLVQKDLLV